MSDFYFTDEEKRAISKVLLDIVNADGRVDVGEARYFRQLQNNLGISDSQIQAAKSMSVLSAIAVIRNMTKAERLAVGIMMHEMIEADGDSNDSDELAVLNTVCLLGDIV